MAIEELENIKGMFQLAYHFELRDSLCKIDFLWVLLLYSLGGKRKMIPQQQIEFHSLFFRWKLARTIDLRLLLIATVSQRAFEIFFLLPITEYVNWIL